MVGTIVLVITIICVLRLCVSLFRKPKIAKLPKVTEFQLAELLEKCKEDPARFFDEYKNTPVFVVGTVKRVSKARASSEQYRKTMLFVTMKAGAEEERKEGKFLIASPESQVVEGQELRVRAYISRICIIYKGISFDGSIREVGISVEGSPERKKYSRGNRLPFSKEGEIYVVPAGLYFYVSFYGYDDHDKTLISASWDTWDNNGKQYDHSRAFFFDSYLKKSELATILCKRYDENVKIKGIREEGSIKGKEEEGSISYSFIRVRHCEILY